LVGKEKKGRGKEGEGERGFLSLWVSKRRGRKREKGKGENNGLTLFLPGGEKAIATNA